MLWLTRFSWTVGCFVLTMLSSQVDDGKKKGLIQEAKQPLLLKEAAGSRKTNEVETAAPKVTLE